MCHLERAAAGVCREAGARVTTTTLLALNLPFVERLDERRIEVIANGVPLFQGAQFAIDTTLVSPLTASGANSTYTGAALHQARQAKERTFPELTRGGANGLSWESRRAAVSATKLPPSFDYWQEQEHDLLLCIPARPWFLDL